MTSPKSEGECSGAGIIPDLVLIVEFNSVFRVKPCLFLCAFLHANSVLHPLKSKSVMYLLLFVNYLVNVPASMNCQVRILIIYTFLKRCQSSVQLWRPTCVIVFSDGVLICMPICNVAPSD